VGAKFSLPLQPGPETHSVSCTVGTESLPGIKRPGRCLHTHLHLAPRSKKEERYLYSPSAPSCSVPGRTLPFR